MNYRIKEKEEEFEKLTIEIDIESRSDLVTMYALASVSTSKLREVAKDYDVRESSLGAVQELSSDLYDILRSKCRDLDMIGL